MLLLSADFIGKQVVPLLQTLSKDPVANVRMNVAKTIKIGA